MRYLTEQEVDDFFRKYLAVFGLDGGRTDFMQMQFWHLKHYYEDCFQKLWPIDRRYGYSTKEADNLRMRVTDPENYNAAIRSYRKQMINGEPKILTTINAETGATKILYQV